MNQFRLKLIICFVSIITLFLVSCSSSESNPADPTANDPNVPPNEEYVIPSLNVEMIEIPAQVSTAAANGNMGAIQTEAVIEMVNSIEDYYQTFNIPGTLNNLGKMRLVNGWTYSWQINDLTVTLEYEDGWGDIIFLNMYYDGTDELGYTYNHWLKGYFSTSLDPEYFAGALQMYQFGGGDPILDFKWGEEEITGKYMDADVMGIFKIRYVYQMYGEAEGTSGFMFNDGYSVWVVDILPDGSGKWTQYVDDSFEDIISEGTW